MLSVVARSTLFLSSYLPLGIIYALLYGGEQNAIAFFSLGLSLLGLLGLVGIVWSSMRDAEPIRDKVVESRLRGDQVMGYIASYLLPFLGTDLGHFHQLMAVLLFLFVLGYLYVTTDMIYINPTLSFLGYKIYEVTLDREGVCTVIARRRLRQGDPAQIVRLSRSIFIARGEAPEA